VVDGNSSDRTVEIARRYTEKIYSDEGKGTSYAHQLGAEQATQEYIAYVDADIVLPEGTLSTMLAELKASGYGNIQAKVLAVSRSTYWERAQAQIAQILQSRKRGGLSAGLLRTETVLNVKFDPSIKHYGDDYAFLSRLKKERYKLGNSSAFVYHHHRANLKNLVKTMFYGSGRGSAHLAREYGPWHAGLWPPLVMLYWLAICLIKGKPQLIPYLVVVGAVQTGGMVKGFFELIKEPRR
jgi:glycosyltransferase involved in cell wall biosynthesis